MSDTPNPPTPGPSPKPGSISTPAPGTVPDPADVEKNKVMALLAYLGPLFLVPLLAATDSPYARFHANQGLNVFLLYIVITIVTVPGACFMGLLTAGVGACLCIPFYFVPLIWSVMGIINASSGKMNALPLIGTITLIK